MSETSNQHSEFDIVRKGISEPHRANNRREYDNALRALRRIEEQLEVMTAQRNMLHMAASSAYAKLKSAPYSTDAEDVLERTLEATSFPAKEPDV